MTRDPMFGLAASTPYAGGTGSTGSPQSHERREREDESGISAHRQAQVLGMLHQAGSTGLTWFELGESMIPPWHHGQSSNALSILHKDGMIAALRDRRGRASAVGEESSRGRSTIYVLKEFVLGRETREPGQTRGNRELADANTVLDRENALLNQKVIDLKATIGERDRLIADLNGSIDQVRARFGELNDKVRTAEQQLALAVEFQARLDDERGRSERGLALAKADLEEALAVMARLEQENSTLRLRHSLARLEGPEVELHARIGARLDDPVIAAASDGQTIRITLGALRTLWTASARLRPDALPIRPKRTVQPAESAPEAPAPAADPAP